MSAETCIWYELHKWGNEEWFKGNKEKARKIFNAAEKVMNRYLRYLYF